MLRHNSYINKQFKHLKIIPYLKKSGQIIDNIINVKNNNYYIVKKTLINFFQIKMIN